MTRDEYNTKVQEIQAMWPEHAQRITPSYRGEELVAAYFEVYWNGQWHSVGVQENPFKKNASYRWYEPVWLRGEFARALIHS